jgi:NAD(P)-dependent dehydrogenase (short-subunit alcohol dehydrogenase family)
MTDRSVMITGVTSGLGAAVASAFRADGWRVVAPIRRSRAELDGIEAVPDVDLTDVDAVTRAVAIAAGDPDRPLRALINLVGGFAMGGKVHETPLADFEAQFAVNVRPTYVVTHAALPALAATGDAAIVCVSSRAAVVPFGGAAGYVSSKAAVIAFAQAVAVEYRQAGVRCNVVLPSVIDTPKNRADQPGADHSKWVPPAQIAKVIRFLAGPDSAPTSGATIPVYGKS